MLKPLVVGWYGKLPSRGDFVGRGLPRNLVKIWDGWLQRALTAAGPRLGPTVLRERLATMPPWHGLVWPQRSGDPAWSGIVIGSTDRVGRAFPLLLAEAFETDALGTVDLVALRARADAMARWLGRSSHVLSPKDLDAALCAWAAKELACPGVDDTRPGSDITQFRFEHQGAMSFWWPAGDGAAGMRGAAPRADSWPPAESLILELLEPPRPGPSHAGS